MFEVRGWRSGTRSPPSRFAPECGSLWKTFAKWDGGLAHAGVRAHFFGAGRLDSHHSHHSHKPAKVEVGMFAPASILERPDPESPESPESLLRSSDVHHGRGRPEVAARGPDRYPLTRVHPVRGRSTGPFRPAGHVPCLLCSSCRPVVPMATGGPASSLYTMSQCQTSTQIPCP